MKSVARIVRVLGATVGTAALLGAGCTTIRDDATQQAPPPRTPVSHPTAAEDLALPEGLGRHFFARQRFSARFEKRTVRLDLVLESACDELRIVGLTPFGVRLFSAVRSEGETWVETVVPGGLPFPPEHVLRDIDRTWFRSPPPAGRGERKRARSRRGERVLESWRDDVLVAREIHPVAADEAEPGDPRPIEIRYAGPVGPTGVAERVDLTNPGRGYSLEIESYAIEPIACPTQPAP